MGKVVITGVASGLGKEVARLLMGNNNNWVIGVDIQDAIPGLCDQYFRCDLANSDAIDTVCTLIKDSSDWPTATLINCAGINEIEWIKDLPVTEFDRVMAVNARSMFLMAQGLLPSLIKTRGTILNIISNASHMPMTASLAYNASKGAAHIMTLQMARELTRAHGITVFGISPNKMAGTGMSRYIEERVCEVRGWTEEYAAQYQKQALLTGEETDPAVLAEFISYLLYNKRNHQYLSGCVIPYGA